LNDVSMNGAAIASYVRAAAALTGMPLSNERAAAVATVFARLGAFAADLEALVLSDDVEIASAAAVAER
jgi:hypothetical protein